MERKNIGDFIIALRKANNMTQQEVANALFISNKTVSKWERNESYPDATIIPVMAELFKVTCDELLKGEHITDNPKSLKKTNLEIDKHSHSELLINKIVSKFKTFSFIAVILTLIGLVCMFLISYNDYNLDLRRINVGLGFGILLIFVVLSLFIEIFSVNKLNSQLNENDLFENAMNDLVTSVHTTKHRYLFNIIFMNFIGMVVSLPIICCFKSIHIEFNYMEIIPFSEYLFALTIFIAPIYFIIYIIIKKSYNNLMLSKLNDEYIETEMNEKNKTDKKTRYLSLLQFAHIVFIFILTYLSLSFYNSSRTLSLILLGLTFLFFLSFLILFVVGIRLFKIKNQKKKLLFMGLRNVGYIISVLINFNYFIINNQVIFFYDNLFIIGCLLSIVITAIYLITSNIYIKDLRGK